MGFFISNELLSTLSLEKQKRAKFLVNADITLIVFFVLAGLMTGISTNNIYFGLPVILLNIILGISLYLIKKGKLVAASSLTLFDVFLNVTLVVIALPYAHYLEMYRYLTYMISLLLLSSLISFHKYQQFMIGAGEFILFNAAVIIKVFPNVEGLVGEVRSSYYSGNAAIIVATVLSVLISSFSKSLVRTAEEEKEKNL
ncbi:MAG: hypothetical protein ACLFR1_00685 [Spirochaetia bacterium]